MWAYKLIFKQKYDDMNLDIIKTLYFYLYVRAWEWKEQHIYVYTYQKWL